MATQGKTKLKDTDAALFELEQTGGQNLGTVSSINAYSGPVGVATCGAPRMKFGENAHTGEDTFMCVVRKVVGDNLFAHDITLGSTFYSDGDAGFCSVDSCPVILKASNHAASYQSRIVYDSPGTMGELAGYVFGSVIAQGHINQVFGVRIRDVQVLGGQVDLMAAIWVDVLEGATSTYGIFVCDNDSYLGGDLGIKGILYGVTTLKASLQVLAGGGIGVGNSTSATSMGTLIKKMQVFDQNGYPLGYVPIYNS